jgi:hypothetical protein
VVPVGPAVDLEVELHEGTVEPEVDGPALDRDAYVDLEATDCVV